jgi:hypothetical protein
VLKTDLEEPNISLIEPEQGAEYDIANGSTSTDVAFSWRTEVDGSRDSKVDLYLQNVGADEDFRRLQRYNQILSDGNVKYNFTESLNESGYRWKVEVTDANGETTTSEFRSFTVDNPETAEVPELPNAEPSDSFGANVYSALASSYASFVALVSSGVLFTLATIATILVGVVVINLSGNDGLGIFSALLTVGVLVAIGWYPTWIGLIMFGISAGILMIGGRKVTTGE